MNKMILAAALAVFSVGAFAATPSFNTLSVQYANTNLHDGSTNQSAELLSGSYVLPGSNLYLIGSAQHVNSTVFDKSEGNDASAGAGVFFPVGTDAALYVQGAFHINNVFSKVYPNRYGEQVDGGLRVMVSQNVELRVGGQVVHANNNDGLRYENKYFGTAGASYLLGKNLALTADVALNRGQTQGLVGVQFQF